MLVTANIFQPLIDVFATIIKFFHDSIGVPWGWSIVLLTVCVRLVLVPLAVKQFHSMRNLQAHQPEMKAIQRKYKEDKQRQQEEMMKFYRENNVNPFGSCLPLVAQLPVFIGLYYTLRTKLRSYVCPTVQTAYQHHYAVKHGITFKAAAGQSIACSAGHQHVTGAGFLFVHDITAQPTGLTLVALLVLYVGTQLASSMLMQAPGMDKQQQRLMMLIPLVMVAFIIRFPAGLIIYWITTNAWTMTQQYVIRRMMGPPPAPAVVEGPGDDDDGGGGLGALLRGRGPRGGDSGGATVKPATSPRTPAAPPRPPRKKKKRSGRRR